MNIDSTKQSEEMLSKVNSLLANAQATMESNIKTSAQAQELANKISCAVESFNTDLDVLIDITEKYYNGKYTKEQVVEESLSSIYSLKSKCIELGIAEEGSNTSDITETEISTLRGVIMGSRALAISKAKELSATESIDNIEIPDLDDDFDEDDLDDDIANEALGGKKASAFIKSPQILTANELVKNAKKLYSYGSKEKAVDYMKKAKSTYEKELIKLKNDRNFKSITRSTAGLIGTPATGGSFGILDTEKDKKVTDSFSLARVAYKLESRIDTCEAYLLQWQNKAGNKEFKETKALLKAERLKERQLGKARQKGVTESMELDDIMTMNLDAVDALESFMAFEFGDDEVATESTTEATEETDDLAALESEMESWDCGEDDEVATESFDAEIDEALEGLE